MPRARARKAAAAAGGPSKAWLDSYADAMTLLLAFFILLYASSIVDEDLFVDFKVGVAQALGKPSPAIDGGVGILDTGNGVTSLIAAAAVPADGQDTGVSPTDDPSEATRENAAEVAKILEERIEAVGAAPYVGVIDDPRGIILRFDSRVLFRSGDAKVLPDGVVVLSAVAEVLAELDNLLVVEGHTDNVPVGGTTWPTNWELSVSRATNVLRYLHEVEQIPALRLSAAGYGDTRPRGSNEDANGRAENRRVEIVVLITTLAQQTLVITDDLAPAPDIGAGIDNPVGPIIVGDGLLDLNPEFVTPNAG